MEQNNKEKELNTEVIKIPQGTGHKIYLAGPFFNEKERNLVKTVAKQLRDRGHDVFVPMEHEVNNAWSYSNNNWSKKVFNSDVSAIKSADEIWAFTFGMTDDAGTCWEVGFAYGLGKPITVITTDPSKTHSLMVYQSCNKVIKLLPNANLKQIKRKEVPQSSVATNFNY